MCNFPSADFALSYGGLPALTQGQLYTIVVDFAIPDSPFNQASGMSLLTVELFDADGNRTMLFRKSVSIKLLASLLSLRVLFTFPLIVSRIHNLLNGTGFGHHAQLTSFRCYN
ncbi:unnamed protein product [Dicrocoelium dendriticum]|nr:unnamed protein product [Dicrocoelium dendriticum]